MGKIDLRSVPIRAGSRYPEPLDEPCKNKLRRQLGLATGLKTLPANGG